MFRFPATARLLGAPSVLTHFSKSHALPLAAAIMAASVAGSAAATPRGLGDDAMLSDALIILGDCGGSIAQQIGDPREADMSEALHRASAAFGTAGEELDLIAQVLLASCEQDGTTACEAAAGCSELAADFGLVARHLADGEIASAAELSRELFKRFDSVFSFGSAEALPEEIRTHLDQASAALERAAGVLGVLGDTAGFEATLDPVLAVAAEGTPSMLAQLQTIEAVQWPADFLGVPVVGLATPSLDWSDGSEAALALAAPESEAALAAWVQLGARGVLERNGGKVLLAELGTFGTSLRDGAYGLRSLLLAGAPVQSGCVFECQNDDDCGPCHIVACGRGTIDSDPEDFWFSTYVLEASIEVDSDMPVNRELRETIQESITQLGEFQGSVYASTRRNILYIKMEQRYCYFSWCWLYWEESSCEARTSEWIRVPTDTLMEQGSMSLWREHHWQKAARDAEIEARDWCQRQ